MALNRSHRPRGRHPRSVGVREALRAAPASSGSTTSTPPLTTSTGSTPSRSPRWRCRSVIASARTRRAPAAPPCRCTSAGVRTASTRRWRCSAPSRARGWSPGPAASPTASRRWRPSSRRSRGCASRSTPVTSRRGARIRSACCAMPITCSSARPRRGSPSSIPTTPTASSTSPPCFAELERLDYPGLMSVEYFDLPDMRMPLDDPVGHAVALAAHVARAPLIQCRVGSDFRTSRDTESPLGQRRSVRKG